MAILIDIVYRKCYYSLNQIIAVRKSKSSFIVHLYLNLSSLQTANYKRFIKVVVFLIDMQTGKIARITDRGFGFISQEGEEKDLFFHSNELKNAQFNELREGDELTFEVAEGPKGLNAVNINKA